MGGKMDILKVSSGIIGRSKIPADVIGSSQLNQQNASIGFGKRNVAGYNKTGKVSTLSSCAFDDHDKTKGFGGRSVSKMEGRDARCQTYGQYMGNRDI
ncbi:MAG: hypothetical protein LBI69_01070 [Puniceicoccales bacterium]|jgi:hypothetical protein|nr:hypothetical protein [Puniceicoccales bacterium]